MEPRGVIDAFGKCVSRRITFIADPWLAWDAAAIDLNATDITPPAFRRNRPLFGDQQSRFRSGEIEDVAHAVACEVDVIDSFR
jgi:hypothetical protein